MSLQALFIVNYMYFFIYNIFMKLFEVFDILISSPTTYTSRPVAAIAIVHLYVGQSLVLKACLY